MKDIKIRESKIVRERQKLFDQIRKTPTTYIQPMRTHNYYYMFLFIWSFIWIWIYSLNKDNILLYTLITTLIFHWNWIFLSMIHQYLLDKEITMESINNAFWKLNIMLPFILIIWFFLWKYILN